MGVVWVDAKTQAEAALAKGGHKSPSPGPSLQGRGNLTRSLSILAVDPAVGKAGADAVEIGHAERDAVAQLALALQELVAGSPEVELQRLAGEGPAFAGGVAWAERARHVLPAIGVGETAGVDGEEVDTRIDVGPGGDAPHAATRALAAGGDRLLGHLDAVAQRLALALGNGGDGGGNHAVEVGDGGGLAGGEAVLRLEHELRQEADRPVLDELGGVDSVVGRDRFEEVARVAHPIDEVPDELPLGTAGGERDVDLDHPQRLERELKAPDVAAELHIVRHAVERVAEGEKIGVPLEGGVRADLHDVVSADRLFGSKVRRDRRQHAGGEQPGSGRADLLCQRRGDETADCRDCRDCRQGEAARGQAGARESTGQWKGR